MQSYNKVDEPVYRKVGRRYKEIGRQFEFDIYRYQKDTGSCAVLLVMEKGYTSYLRHVDPDRASVVAAMKIAKEAITSAVLKASELKPSPQPITPEQRELLDKLAATGFNASQWSYASIADAVQAGIDKLEENLN